MKKIGFLILSSLLILSMTSPVESLEEGDSYPQIPVDLDPDIFIAPFQPDEFPDTEVGRMIDRHLKRMVAGGPFAQKNYMASLSDLKNQSVEVVRMILDLYPQVPEERYLKRWLMIYILYSLAEPETLEALIDLARSPLPENKIVGHHFSSQKEELMIRQRALLAAVEIIKKIPEEIHLLDQFLYFNNMFLRQTALRSVLNLSSQEQLAEVKNRLLQMMPESDHFLIQPNPNPIHLNQLYRMERFENRERLQDINELNP